MYRNSPKVIIKVDLLTNNGLKIHLLLLNEFFIGKNIKRPFFSDDMFMIQTASFFSVFKSKSIYFPKNFKDNKNRSISLMFDDEDIRHEFLRDLSRGLVEWSYSYFWKGFNKPEDSRIIYNKNLWILF